MFAHGRRRLSKNLHVHAEVMRMLGSLSPQHRRRTTSFLNHPRRGRPDRIRLCAVGDSFTYGAEVGASHGFPELLKAIFRERGASNVDVLNFGNGWHGFHQNYTM